MDKISLLLLVLFGLLVVGLFLLNPFLAGSILIACALVLYLKK